MYLNHVTVPYGIVTLDHQAVMHGLTQEAHELELGLKVLVNSAGQILQGAVLGYNKGYVAFGFPYMGWSS